jgi:hypothetical protein
MCCKYPQKNPVASAFIYITRFVWKGTQILIGYHHFGHDHLNHLSVSPIPQLHTNLTYTLW